MKRLVLGVICLAMTACGASPGSDTRQGGGVQIMKDALTSTDTAPVSDIVTLKLSTEGDLGGALISGLEFTLKLPPGVTLDATASGEVAAGEISASGVNAGPDYVMARYVPGQVRVAIINSHGFPGGEFLTVICRRTPGLSVAPTDFRIDEFRAADFTPVNLASVVPTFTVDVR